MPYITSQKYSYDQYIISDAWFQRRDVYFEMHDRICMACESTELIDLHHMTYNNLGSEKDEDLISLCKACHDQYHAIYENASLADSKEFVIAKRASKKGKEIFLKNQDLITVMVHGAVMEYDPEILELDKIKKDHPNYELLPYKQRQDIAEAVARIIKNLNSIPFLVVSEIIKHENPDIGVFIHEGGMRESRGEHKLKAIRFLPEYRWVAEEIRSILPGNRGSYTELQKLKRVLMLDAFSLEMKKNGYWQDAGGWHSSGFLDLFLRFLSGTE